MINIFLKSVVVIQYLIMLLESCYSCNENDEVRNDIITWKLKMEPELYKDDKTSYKEIYIDNQKNIQQRSHNFKLKIKCLGRGNDVLEIYYLFPKSIYCKYDLSFSWRLQTAQQVEKNYHVIQSNKWEYVRTLFKKDITNYFEDKCLKFVFRFDTMKNVVPLENVPKRGLSNDFQYLLDTGLFSDIIVKSTEGTEFNAHKAILAGRSAVLKAHFDHNTLECHTKIVKSHLETDTLREVLTFIYSDTSPKVDDIPEKLLAAAEFYQLDKLKHLCEKTLHDKLSMDNAVETLELADLHSAKLLRNLTLEFIKHGLTKDIIKTEGWAKLKSIDLVKSIYEHVMDNNDGDKEQE